MTRIMWIFLLAATSLVSGQQPDVNQEHRKWIASVIASIQTIKPGMTRNDLLQVFTTEGGISNRLHRTYVYKQCPYIKVTVDFEATIKHAREVLTEMPEDRITKISTPFLQYGVID